MLRYYDCPPTTTVININQSVKNKIQGGTILKTKGTGMCEAASDANV